MLFDSRNVTFTDVDLNGTKVGASILFPKDPKRRLEIWWSNSTNRSGIYLILINGQSTWGAPGGMRLGLTLAELEKLNHKPFKLKGFDKDNVATVSGWDGGALATLDRRLQVRRQPARRPEGPRRCSDRVAGRPRIQFVRSGTARGQPDGQRNSARLLGSRRGRS